MKVYVENIIPRLKKFSESLDKMESFVEKPWVLIDEKMNYQKYIFRRNGQLIMSHNGEVQIGSWEYISIASSLLINRITDKILLNQNFIDSGIMVLKKDGFNNDTIILLNEVVVPDLDVLGYMKRLYYQKYAIKNVKLKSGQELEILHYNYTLIEKNSTVTIDGQSLDDVILEDQYEKKYVIKDSIINKILVLKNYKTNIGEIKIEQQQFENARIGDCVFQNNSLAIDGKYKIGFMKFVHTEGGIIIKITSF